MHRSDSASGGGRFACGGLDDYNDYCDYVGVRCGMAKTWTVAEAKAKFSEVLEKAEKEGRSGSRGAARKPQSWCRRKSGSGGRSERGRCWNSSRNRRYGDPELRFRRGKRRDGRSSYELPAGHECGVNDGEAAS